MQLSDGAKGSDYLRSCVHCGFSLGAEGRHVAKAFVAYMLVMLNCMRHGALDSC